MVRNADGTPYRSRASGSSARMCRISPLPELCAWWMEKRRYLLEMGVDGFKTDGGEFMHDLSGALSQRASGVTMRNRYVADYEAAYTRAIGNNLTLFSRAGYLGAQITPIHWARRSGVLV